MTVKIKMSKKIEKKIVGYKVVSDEVKAETEAKDDTNIIQMHEKVSRPETLSGSTYKIKTPLSDHAMYFCLLYTSPSPRDGRISRMPSSA